LVDLMRDLVGAAALVATLAVAACGATAQPSAQAVGDVSLRVTGGITGWDRTVVVGADGKVTYTVLRGPSPSATATQLDAATLQRLHRLVADPAFANLDAEYWPPPGGADLQRYDVTAKVGDRTVTSASWDGARPPQILRDVLDILNTALVKASI
jgi:hypothetical protein